MDDDQAVREALFDLLQVEGLAARMFENGATFLADAHCLEFGCIVTDVRMPEMDGLELQRRLRGSGSAIPVIFITSSVNEGTRERALSDGAVAWFTKPVADAELLLELRAALQRRNTGR
ncbi:response regulator transcription factor [Sphingomonas asaccharolytica]|uniref:response regulator transcription factor n=1 Tax=Sphingomonas asaccharolytica TaxID=40681 RepID=UPI00082CF223|nr:response regulator [Sphingomonas asaccharolytica]